MQPQGHLQFVSNLVDFDMDMQSALDAPRFRIEEELSLERGYRRVRPDYSCFPDNTSEETPEPDRARLRQALETYGKRHGLNIDLKQVDPIPDSDVVNVLGVQPIQFIHLVHDHSINSLSFAAHSVAIKESIQAGMTKLIAGQLADRPCSTHFSVENSWHGKVVQITGIRS